jgi:sirohydrochlorin ferrochelatase
VTLVLVAHGTRDPAGTATICALADLVREGVPDVRVAFADVRQPDVTTVLREVDGPAAVVVPAFLAAGYHVLVDIPAQVRAAGVPAVITPHLGVDLVAVARQRLVEAGWRPGQRVVLAASGSSDPRARAEVRMAARRLGAERVGFVTDPLAVDRDVAVASWFLAPGVFHRRARECGARVVAEPLGVHPAIAQLITLRYATARPTATAGARSGQVVPHYADRPR